MYYMNDGHQYRFDHAVRNNQTVCTGKGYNLLKNVLDELWEEGRRDFELRLSTSNAVLKQAIKFSACKYSNFTAEQYTLFRAAQDIYTGSNYINLQDLADTGVIRRQIFEAIVEAMRIARKGYEYIGIDKPFRFTQEGRIER